MKTQKLKKDNLTVGAKGGAIAFALKIGSTAFGFINQIVLARILGAGGVGEVLLAVSIVKVSSQVAKFGMEETMMRFLPPYIDQNNNSLLKGTIFYALKFCFVVSIIAAFLVAIFSRFVSSNIFHSEILIILLPVIAISIPAGVIRDVIGGVMKSYKDSYRALLPESIISPVFRLFVFLLLTLKDTTPLYAVIAFVVAELFSMLLSIRFLSGKLKELRSVDTECENRRVLAVARTMIFASVGLFLYTQADIWILGIYETKDVVGIYGIAAKLVLLIYFPMLAFASIVPPIMASSYAAGDYKELERVTRESTRWILSIAMPIILILILEGNYILRYFYGAEFEAGYLVLVILTLVHLINTGTGLVGVFLQMTGQHNLYMKINIFFGVLNVTLNLFLVPRYGMVGAAIATAFCLSSLEIICTFIIYRKFAISTLPEGINFDVLFILVVSGLYYLMTYFELFRAVHLLLFSSLLVYLWKSLLQNDIPWRLIFPGNRD